MPALPNAKHEAFATHVANGLSATKSYICAGYSAQGAHASANRLLQDVTICSRVKELRPEILQAVIQSTAMDKAWWLRQLRVNVIRARKIGQFTASTQALNVIGQSLGYIDPAQDADSKPVRVTAGWVTQKQVAATATPREGQQAEARVQ